MVDVFEAQSAVEGIAYSIHGLHPVHVPGDDQQTGVGAGVTAVGDVDRGHV